MVPANCSGMEKDGSTGSMYLFLRARRSGIPAQAYFLYPLGVLVNAHLLPTETDPPDWLSRHFFGADCGSEGMG